MKTHSSFMRTIAAGVVATVALVASHAHAQLSPQRLYYGVDRPVPIDVNMPAGTEGDARIDLLEPETANVLASTAVVAGTADLASLFDLWNKDSHSLAYAQLVVGEKKIGPALVVQPLLNPSIAVIENPNDPRAAPVFPRTPQTFSGFRIYVDKHVVMHTSMGDIKVRMRPDQAPNTCWNFMHLVEGGFYNEILFHRVLGDFVIQAGDPTGMGSGGPGYNFDLEDSKLPHDFGVLSTARSGDPNSNGSQIFICLTRERTAALDGRYTSYGQTVSGFETIRQIGTVPLRGDRPVDPPVWHSAALVDAPPYGEGFTTATPAAGSDAEER